MSSWPEVLVRITGRRLVWYVVCGLALTAIASSLISARSLADGGGLSGLPAGAIEIPGSGAGPPQLVFACEQATNQLESLFSDPSVIADLKNLKASLSLAITDLSPGRAGVARQLNEAGIPVTAWLVLPKDQGYFLNAGNASEAVARFTEFDNWTANYGLRWASVGLDIEPNFREIHMLTQGHPWRLAPVLVRRSLDSERVQRATEAYTGLIKQIQGRGYPVETYQFPFIADERRAHSTLLERLLGMVDVRGDHEALMLYTSFQHSLGASVIWEYGSDAQVIVVGSTGGNSELDSSFAPLNWDELSRDLLVARHFTDTIGVYSLEGCLRQGFLPRLKTMNWRQSVTLPAKSVRKAALLRTKIRFALWAGSHLLYFAVATIAGIVWLICRRQKRKRRIAQKSLGPSAP